MAWIKAQNENLFDVTSIHVQDRHSCEVRGRTHGFVGTFTLGTYRSNATAQQAKEAFQRWLDRRGCLDSLDSLDSRGHSVFEMPSEDWEDYLVEQERNCRTCNLIRRAGRTCQTCGTGHTNWKPRAVPDVKVFPAHDASKQIHGLFNIEPGEIVEVVVGDETLTCKVLKVVRKGSHGIFTMELKE